MDISSVRFIYFDIDDTLLDHAAAAAGALQETHSKFSSDIGYIPFNAFIERFQIENSAVWLAMARRELTPEDVKLQRFTRTLAHLTGERAESFNQIGKALSKTFLEHYGQFWKLFAGAEEALTAAENIAPTGLLSNGFPEQQYGKLRHFGWENRFAAVVLSADAGAMKPERAIFEFAGNAAGIGSPNELLYIGDTYETDVEGAKNAGWQTIWLNHGNKAENGNSADLTVSSLKELPFFLK
ncbi:hypothetical protein MASR2M18_05610 [Ignavibacteria bacterium]|nr:HAD family hydrolase [Bacteroidota bacterium]MCZ2132081.1 HAD family hydrolase [Bacteroidota bacterium]